MNPSNMLQGARKVLFRSLAIATLATAASTASAGSPAGLALPAPEVAEVLPPSLAAGRPAAIDPSLRRARGPVEVWVKLTSASLAAARGDNAKSTGGLLSLAQRRAHLAALAREHDGLSHAAGRLGGVELARVSRAHNAVALRIDAARIPDLAALPGVAAVRPVRDYEMALSETVPYIGAAAAQAAGHDGSGARVAVLDSGIDYTHGNLGGPGTLAAFAAAQSYPNIYYPSSKVVGGFDFVGSTWPSGPLAPDANPIDDGSGHGTHVADIIAGRSADGAHVGVAPGAQLYAVKVCSSVATSCSGVALLQGVDFALDPNGDGSMADAVDVMNLSLGSSYGQQEDDLSEALQQAVHFGVVVVAAAGNSGNLPYVVSSPSTAPGVISVAQTQVPSARSIPLVVNSPASIAGVYANTEQVGWAPVDHGVTGDVAYVGRGCPGDNYLVDPAGKVALIDRGSCAVSLKVDRAAQAGAAAVVVGLVAAGDPISFSFGGGSVFVPTLIVTKGTADRLKANLAAPVNVTISPASAIPLVGSMVASSARGPSMSRNAIKPEIGAPGASVSAEFGTGTGQTAFGGTSGATPMVAGSAAILVGALPGITPTEVKARLMNNAETQIFHNQALRPGYLAPVGRIGAGEVRVNRALGATTAAWVKGEDSAALSFGYHALSRRGSFQQTVKVKNLSRRGRTYSVASSFRYPGKAPGAVEVRVPSTLRVGGRETEELEVSLVVHPELLPSWTIDGGPQGGNGSLLDALEMDGFITLTSGTETISLPWHLLPHRAADLATADEVRPGRFLNVFNRGVADGEVELFALTGRSSRIPRSQLPQPGDNFAVVDLRAVGVRDMEGLLQFGITTFGARAHPNYPAGLEVDIDVDRDGVADFAVWNGELGGFAATGQNVVYVTNLATGATAAYFYADADLDSSNVILTAPYGALGLTPGTTFNFSVYAYDNYFTGWVTDAIEGMTFTPAMPRYAADSSLVVPPQGVGGTSVVEVAGGATLSPSQSGFLLLYRHSDPANEAQLVSVER